MRVNTSAQCEYSVASVFRNLRRAGVLKYKFAASIRVPTPPAVADTCHAPLWFSIQLACVDASVREETRIFDTDAIEASASPRNPIDSTCSSSSNERILLVAWRVTAKGNCSADMPQPLSEISISVLPPSSRRKVISVAPASSAFSSNSLTTDAGRSTTSPAAIWLMSWSGSWMMSRCGARRIFMACAVFRGFL